MNENPLGFQKPDGGSDERRDRELATRINSVRVPDHGPGFWAGIQTTIEGETAPVGHRTRSETATRTRSVVDIDWPGPTNDLVSRQSADDSRRRPLLMVLGTAAAVLLLAVAATALVMSNNATVIDAADDSESQENNSSFDRGNESLATGESDGEGGDTDASEMVPMPNVHKPVAVTTIGSGLFVGFTPDESGMFFLVEADEDGCHGNASKEILVHNLISGDRVSALPEDKTIGLGDLVLDGSFEYAEVCDDVIVGHWIGSMAPDGIVSDMTEVDASGLSFTPEEVDDFPVSTRQVSSNGRYEVVTDDKRLRVECLKECDNEDQDRLGADQSFHVPDELLNVAIGDAIFDPTGQIVTFTTANQVWFWNFRTGEISFQPVDGASRLEFSDDGTLLAIQAIDKADIGGTPEETVLDAIVITFEGGPIPAAKKALTSTGCSGELELEPLEEARLIADGLPQAVAKSVAAIDAAAASCDWAALAELGPGVVTLGGSVGAAAIDFWISQEREGSGAMGDLRQILRQPFDMPTDDRPLYLWPSVSTVEQPSEYVGYFTMFEEDGTWELLAYNGSL